MTKRGIKASAGSKKKLTAREREEMLIENFVGLQTAMTNLSIKFEKLSDNISQLLKVFEEAAKKITENTPDSDKDLLNKINSLLDQNKTIARGLVLMEDKLKSRVGMPPQSNQETARPRIRPLPSI